ncbi:MAG TPA: sulfotransferase [Pirellulales bacterium]|jgi:hypothetical protein|nr:sulfotransferase [Pirellulales bacterium]
MRFRTWMGLLIRNRFRITPWRWAMCVVITLTSLGNSALHFLHALIFNRRLARTKLAGDPIFIIGHWRSGTTYLHELLVRDDRFAFPTTFECFMPQHTLLTEWFVVRFLKFLLPAQRPMDDMAAGWDRPQEDEFALCNLGVGSPYTTMAFPNEPPQGQEFLELEQVTPAQLQRWKRSLHWFLQLITYRSGGKRIILKSPTHTARVKVLLEMFPQAKFVHIVRDPHAIFPSTVRLWKSLYRAQACQTANFQGLEEYVFECFERMYRQFDAQRELIPAGHLYEVRYEDLVREPAGQLQAIYEQLELGDFEQVRPAMEQYLSGTKDYKPNRHVLAPKIREQIERRWGGYLQRYGYRADS